jgi:hypothetical protein
VKISKNYKKAYLACFNFWEVVLLFALPLATTNDWLFA